MKRLTSYIKEGLLSRKVSTKAPIRYKPYSNEELRDIIVDLLKKGITDLNCIDISNISNLSNLFEEVNNRITVEEIDISEWDVSKIRYMYGMFEGCKKFTADLSKWDVSHVENMCLMFRCCENFNSDLSKWNTSKLKESYAMFDGCKNFNSDLSRWDVSNVNKMNDMFAGCTTLEQNNKIPRWYKG